MTLDRVMTGTPLTIAEARKIVTSMMEGVFSREETAAILSILAYRGETAEEISGFAQGMLDKASSMSFPYDVLDTCGTGGDGSGTYNVSTASAILLSSMGVKVAKHGNRSVSSKTGSADVLEELRIPFQGNVKEAEQRLEDYSLTFFFAPVYHMAMKNVAPVRKALKQKTIFNILGPLTNPARAPRRVIGAYSLDAARKMAHASLHLPIERALFVTGEDGLDEFTVQGASYVIELQDNELREYTINPEDVGLKRSSLHGALVNNAAESAALIRDIFRKKASREAVDLLLLNAGAALYTSGVAETIKDGVEMADHALGEPVLAHLEKLQLEEGAEML
ncbi:anthranilate phosphoribosyltransferase [Alkalicoccus halolimnae]|uniref:Anthranilate phosphoribosyltransferase n=1 Tax=Alkalicoccus halolimnae TaxID=1667239 RepID=A0A5C7F2L1_9BACI|nr:anthranilate phosphoribosyltransferase [Alkalicoccus halolimnae]TXF83001.1 anthranilate phosphoribosyltransferase [Alkalicoccus halolimnae]